MNKKYRVVFLGLIKSRDEFILYLSRFGIKTHIADMIINKAPVTLKENLRLGLARRYVDVFQNAGGRVSIQPHGFFKEELDPRHVNIEPMENFTVCPQCGFKQLRVDECKRCGLVLNSKITGK